MDESNTAFERMLRSDVKYRFAADMATLPQPPARDPQPRLGGWRCRSMDQTISIARPAGEVFDYLSDPAHLPDWLPQLRRQEGEMPKERLKADKATGKIAWSFAPSGWWRVTASGRGTVLALHLTSDTAIAADPTEAETPRQAAMHAAEAAMHSVKSHLERAGGGDPGLRIPDASLRVFGRDASEDTDRTTR